MRKYDEEFKREAVRKIHDGQSVASVARELGCAESLLHRWKRDAVEASSDAEKELIALRKPLREVEMERDILKRRRLSSAGAGSALSVHRSRACELPGQRAVSRDESLKERLSRLSPGQKPCHQREQGRGRRAGQVGLLPSPAALRLTPDRGRTRRRGRLRRSASGALADEAAGVASHPSQTVRATNDRLAPRRNPEPEPVAR